MCATIVDVTGSVPTDAGAKMLVTADGAYYGTVGGGKVEKRIIDEACSMIRNAQHSSSFSSKTGDAVASDNANARFFDWSLNRDIGMTCGGSVRVYLESFNQSIWHITVFGAGHVGQALISLLTNLDCRVTCIDSRVEWLDKLPDSPKLRRVLLNEMKDFVPEIPKNSYVLLMTMGHTTDKPILLEILKNWKNVQYPYLGVIGSKAKAARLRMDIREAELPEKLGDVFYCPIGLPIGSNNPQEIAISVSAQLIEVRDRVASAVKVE